MAMTPDKQCHVAPTGSNEWQDKSYDEGSTIPRDEPAVGGHQGLKECLSFVVNYVLLLEF